MTRAQQGATHLLAEDGRVAAAGRARTGPRSRQRELALHTHTLLLDF